METKEKRFMPYRTKPEDTLDNLAHRFGMDVEMLTHYNGTAPISPGQIIRIPLLWRMCPIGLLYPLGRNESLLDVAKRFQTSLSRLLAQNPFLDPKRVVPGQVLIVSAEQVDQKGAETNA